MGQKSSVKQSLRAWRQYGEYGAQIMLEWSKLVYLPAAVLGRDAKEPSWVCRKALAIFAEEPTTTDFEPNQRCMMGPYFWDRTWRDLWGNRPMRLRFPMTGHALGPGGRLGLRR